MLCNYVTTCFSTHECTYLHLLLSGLFKKLLLLTQQFFLGYAQSVKLALATLTMFLQSSMKKKTLKSHNIR